MSNRANLKMVKSDTPMEPSGTPDSERASTSTMETSGDPSVDVVVIPANRVMPYWAQVKPIVWEALDTGEIAPEAMLRDLLKGDKQLWVAMDDEILGAAITEVVRYHRVRSLRVIGLAGKRFSDWHGPLDALFERILYFFI